MHTLAFLRLDVRKRECRDKAWPCPGPNKWKKNDKHWQTGKNWQKNSKNWQTLAKNYQKLAKFDKH